MAALPGGSTSGVQLLLLRRKYPTRAPFFYDDDLPITPPLDDGGAPQLSAMPIQTPPVVVFTDDELLPHPALENEDGVLTAPPPQPSMRAVAFWDDETICPRGIEEAAWTQPQIIVAPSLVPKLVVYEEFNSHALEEDGYSPRRQMGWNLWPQPRFPPEQIGTIAVTPPLISLPVVTVIGTTGALYQCVASDIAENTVSGSTSPAVNVVQITAADSVVYVVSSTTYAGTVEGEESP